MDIDMGSITSAGVLKCVKDGDSYRLKCGEVIIADMSHVAIAFSVDGNGVAIVQRCGTPSNVWSWFKWAKNSYEQLGLTEFANQLRVMVSNQWNVDDLNRILQDESFLTEFLRSRCDVSVYSVESV